MANFKDSMGRWYTKGIFWEMCNSENKGRALYTLKEEDHKGLPSLKKLYLQCADITEYSFATEHLGGWLHWKLLSKSSWFKPYLKDWREELEVSIRSKGLKAVIEHATSTRGQASAKWLAEKGWVEAKRGAPTKQEVESETRRQASVKAAVRDDMLRLIK